MFVYKRNFGVVRPAEKLFRLICACGSSEAACAGGAMCFPMLVGHPNSMHSRRTILFLASFCTWPFVIGVSMQMLSFLLLQIRRPKAFEVATRGFEPKFAVFSRISRWDCQLREVCLASFWFKTGAFIRADKFKGIGLDSPAKSLKVRLACATLLRHFPDTFF